MASWGFVVMVLAVAAVFGYFGYADRSPSRLHWRRGGVGATMLVVVFVAVVLYAQLGQWRLSTSHDAMLQQRQLLVDQLQHHPEQLVHTLRQRLDAVPHDRMAYQLLLKWYVAHGQREETLNLVQWRWLRFHEAEDGQLLQQLAPSSQRKTQIRQAVPHHTKTRRGRG